MRRLLLVTALVLLSGCTMKRAGAASSDTVNTESRDTASTQQGVSSPDNPTPPPNDSGKEKPKASDLSNPTTK